MFSFNPTLGKVKESATLAINQKAKRLRKDGAPVFHFGFGESPFPVHPLIQAALSEHSSSKEYLPGLGLPELRERIVQFYQEQFHYPHSFVAVGPGSKELIYQAMYVLGGDIILPSPSWVSYEPQAVLLGKKIIPLPTSYEECYKINPVTLDRLTSSREQKILILNSPNNPTGQVYHEEELSALARVCEKNNILVLSDEIYSLVTYNRDYVGISKFIPERTIVTSGMSKAFSAGGYRLGFLLSSSAELMEKLSVIISETYSCVCSPVQYAAMKAYENNHAIMEYVYECTRIHSLVVNYAARRFQEMGLNCHKGEGGFYVFPDFLPFQKAFARRNITDSQQLCNHFIEELGLFFLPGEDFGCAGERLSVRAAVVDYDGGKVHALFKRDPDFSQKLASYPELSSIKTGLDLLEHYLGRL